MTNDSSNNCTPLNPLVIHATNVLGLGAQQVVQSLLDALLPLAPYDPITVFLPDQGALAAHNLNLPNVQLVPFHRKLPRQISRLRECVWPPKCLQGDSPMLVLGDVPLAGRRNQIVLVHQPNLLAPSVNPNVGRTWTMRIMRSVFRRNHPMANALIVQTEVMGDQLAQSYDGLRGRMSVIPQPPPTWALHTEAHSKQPTVGQFDLFYPAAGYPHKNHQLLTGMTPSLIEADPSVGNVKISITLETELANQFDFPATIENLGRLDVSQVQQVYQRSDALFFPSLLESLELPLVEAIFMNLPVVCANPPWVWISLGLRTERHDFLTITAREVCPEPRQSIALVEGA